MSSQCVGPSLDVNDGTGVLDIRIAGAPAAAAMPGSGNGLRLDTGRGLWAPADHTAVQINGYLEHSLGGVVAQPGTSRKTNVLTMTVTNPSPTRSLLCLLNFDGKEVHSIAQRVDATNSGWTGWGFLFGYDTGADPASSVVLTPELVRRDMGFVQGEKSFTHSHHEAAHLLVAPGDNTKVRFQLGLACYDYGFVRCTSAYLRITGLGVTV